MGWIIAIILLFILTPLILQITVYRGVIKLRALGSKAWPGLFSALFLLIAAIFSILIGIFLGQFYGGTNAIPQSFYPMSNQFFKIVKGIFEFFSQFNGQKSLVGLIFLGQLCAGGTWVIVKRKMTKRLISRNNNGTNSAQTLSIGMSFFNIVILCLTLIAYSALVIFILAASGGG